MITNTFLQNSTQTGGNKPYTGNLSVVSHSGSILSFNVDDWYKIVQSLSLNGTTTDVSQMAPIIDEDEESYLITPNVSSPKINFTFPYAVRFVGLQVTGWGSTSYTLYLQGSNDNSTWTTLFTATPYNAFRSYLASTNSFYKYYRFSDSFKSGSYSSGNHYIRIDTWYNGRIDFQNTAVKITLDSPLQKVETGECIDVFCGGLSLYGISPSFFCGGVLPINGTNKVINGRITCNSLNTLKYNGSSWDVVSSMPIVSGKIKSAGIGSGSIYLFAGYKPTTAILEQTASYSVPVTMSGYTTDSMGLTITDASQHTTFSNHGYILFP